jgi:hypothetical protein
VWPEGRDAAAESTLKMDAREFLGLRATHNPVRWYFEVVPGICTDEKFLFGGCGLGAAIEALERTTGRPAVWAVDCTTSRRISGIITKRRCLSGA